MKLLFVISAMTSGGAERQAALICNHWAAAGHVIKVATFDSLGSHYPLDPAIGRELVKGRLRALLHSDPPDVIISFMDTVNVKTLLAARGLGIPVIVSERSIPAALYRMNGPIRSVLFGLLRRVLYRRAAALVVQTKATLPWGRGIARRAEIISNAVATSIAPPTKRSTTVLAVGRFTKEKGHSLLLEAFAKIADRFPVWRLVLCGDGPLRTELERQAHGLGLTQRVAMTGVKVGLAEDYASAGLFVLPSLFEGFPNALIEAMQAGCAVIASDCPVGPREIVQDGEDGLLFANGDISALAQALARAMEDPALRSRLGEAAVRKAERYRPEHIFPLWDALLASVCKTGPISFLPKVR